MRSLKVAARKAFPKLYRWLALCKMHHQMRKFSRVYPECRLFFSVFKPEARVHYSQFNQDYIVYKNFFYGVHDGIYCDVGGNHPLNINNTRLFEERGWSGMVFEPLPHMRELWEQHRNATFFPIAASDSEGEVEFSVVVGEAGWENMLSYVGDTSTPEYDYQTREIVVQTRPLKNVFNELGVISIDYMSIDVEGHEINVINGIDFDAVKIKVLTIENNYGGVGNFTHYGDDRIREYMLSHGYLLWGRIVSLDDIYVHRDFLAEIEKNAS